MKFKMENSENPFHHFFFNNRENKLNLNIDVQY